MVKAKIWLHGMLAAVISGGANGVITGFAAIGIDPGHFNLASGFGHTLSLAGVSAVMSAIIGVAAYLKQSPLPRDSGWSDSDGDAWQHPDRQPEGRNERRPAEAPVARATTAALTPTTVAATSTVPATGQTSMPATARTTIWAARGDQH